MREKKREILNQSSAWIRERERKITRTYRLFWSSVNHFDNQLWQCFVYWIFLLLSHSLTETIEDENLFYIVSPKDIIVSKERDTDDHVAWLLDREEFEVTIQTYFHRYIYVLFIIYERSGRWFLMTF